MNLRYLLYYCKLIELQSFTDTARFFNISQPSISTALQSLENYYGVKLIIRRTNSHSFTPTNSGIYLYNEALELLKLEKLIKNDIQLMSEPKIRFGIPTLIGDYLLTKSTDNLRQHDFFKHLEMVEYGTNNLLSKLRRGQLDLALVGIDEMHAVDDLNVLAEFSDEMKIFMSKKDKFINYSYLTVEDIADREFISLNNGSIHLKLLQDLFRDAKLPLKIELKTNNPLLIRDLVSSGLYLTYLSDIISSRIKENLIGIPIRTTRNCKLHIALLSRKNRKFTHTQEEVISTLENLVQVERGNV